VIFASQWLTQFYHKSAGLAAPISDFDLKVLVGPNLSTQLEKECCDLLEQCCCQFQGKTSIYL
jgi:hypothetical protein